MRNSIKRLCSEIKSNIIRNCFMFITSAMTILISSFIVGLLLIGLLNLEKISNEITDSIQIYVQIADDISPAGIELLQQQIEGLSDPLKVTYSDKDEALNQYVDFYGENGEFFEMWREDNPLKNSFSIELQDPSKVDDIAAQIRELHGVYEVTYGGDSVLKALEMLNSVRIIGLLGCILFLFLMVFVLSNTINQTIYNRRDEIGIMSSVGASPRAIMVPFIAEGIIICLVGCLPAAGTLSVLYSKIVFMFDGSILPGSIQLIAPSKIQLILAVVFVVMSFVAGAGCAATQTSKHLK